LAPGSVVAFTGDLGAGKTAFVRGMARGLGIPARVTSPTFTIVNEYEGGRLPLFHFDMYRLSSSEELFDIGWEDFLRRGGICAVEWSENITDALEGDTIWVDIRRGQTDQQRIITVKGWDEP
jgi:tRNA threonylcarbamoyladenosine biosynthesis protein TsaE